jgi:hypothetical protein
MIFAGEKRKTNRTWIFVTFWKQTNLFFESTFLKLVRPSAIHTLIFNRYPKLLILFPIRRFVTSSLLNVLSHSSGSKIVNRVSYSSYSSENIGDKAWKQRKGRDRELKLRHLNTSSKHLLYCQQKRESWSTRPRSWGSDINLVSLKIKEGQFCTCSLQYFYTPHTSKRRPYTSIELVETNTFEEVDFSRVIVFYKAMAKIRAQSMKVQRRTKGKKRK